MVDFSALMKSASQDDPVHPRDIFNELPKTGEIHDLYQVQAEILDAWYENRTKHGDIVVELNTGGGKTLVGLLIALSITRETKKGSLYLVENRQLANQVVEQAKQLGIPARAYAGRDSLDADFDNGSVVLVGAYQSLFNGKSVFGVRGSRNQPLQLGGIVVDDAHASLGALREVFTLTIPANSEPVIYKKVLAEFEGAFKALEKENTYSEFREGIGTSVTEVPYAYWRKAEKRVSSILLEQAQARESKDDPFSDSLKFNWPLLKDNLKYCQVAVSRNQITIAAMYPLLNMIPSFKGAERRVYMSATITDYGDMVRAYDLRGLTSGAVIAPKSVSGVGRRMILFPSVEYLNSEKLLGLLQQEMDNHHGVVRLSPRVGSSVIEELSFYEPVGHDDVSAAIETLRNGTAKMPVSFVNRYNGIDLPGDACRVLIVEDLPAEIDDIDSIMSGCLRGSSIATQRIAQKIEQGVGRGVRGSSDHCVVLIVGNRLIDWMKREKNRKFFSPAFQVQLVMGDRINEGIDSASGLCGAMRQELESDEGWITFHAQELSRRMPDRDDRFGRSFEAACVERRAFAQWMERKSDAAIGSITNKLGRFKDDESYQGWLLGIASRIAFDSGKISESAELLSQAHSLNRQIENVKIGEEDKVSGEAMDQAKGIIKKLCSIGSASVLSRFDSDMAGLAFGTPFRDFELSLCALGSYLGFDSSREDRNGEGSDVYWVDSARTLGWALEAKNEKHSENPLNKTEAGQLRTACDWLRQKHDGIEAIPVSVHPNALAYKNASASNLYALAPDRLDALKRETRALIAEASCFSDEESAVELARVLENRSMLLENLTGRFLCPFKVSEE